MLMGLEQETCSDLRNDSPDELQSPASVFQLLTRARDRVLQAFSSRIATGH